jgi:hypothetical protein
MRIMTIFESLAQPVVPPFFYCRSTAVKNACRSQAMCSFAEKLPSWGQCYRTWGNPSVPSFQVARSAGLADPLPCLLDDN